jgi:hypothetical protein
VDDPYVLPRSFEIRLSTTDCSPKIMLRIFGGKEFLGQGLKRIATYRALLDLQTGIADMYPLRIVILVSEYDTDLEYKCCAQWIVADFQDENGD